jgi:HlyD family secretion protein
MRRIPGGRWWLWGTGAVLVVAAVSLALRPSGGDGSTFLTGQVERGTVRTSIAANGTLQAVLTVQVGSQVTGRVQSLHADFNSMVRKGQVIARIDPATFDATLVRARADLEDARAGVTTARSALQNQKASREGSLVTLEDARRVHERNLELAKGGVVSARDLEASEVAVRDAEARRKQAEAQVASAEAAIEQAEARVKQAQAQVKLAEVNLEYTVISSPVDGVVVSRNVDVGQTVAASLQAPTLFVIANDLTRMQVVANVDEADIGQIGPEARVSFSVDSFPGEFFHGRIDQIRLNPIITQNVVTYSVIVNVDNPELKLRPGMTANTTFTIAEAAEALRLPNAALRYWPADTPRDKERELIAAATGNEEMPGPGRPHEAAAQGGAMEPVPPANGAPAGGRGQRGSRRGGAEPGSSEVMSAEPGEVLRFPQIRKVRWRPRVVWVQEGDAAPQPKVVRVGITDGTVSEIRDGDLPEGATVITGLNQLTTATEARPNNPLSGRPNMKAGGGRRP